MRKNGNFFLPKRVEGSNNSRAAAAAGSVIAAAAELTW